MQDLPVHPRTRDYVQKLVLKFWNLILNKIKFQEIKFFSTLKKLLENITENQVIYVTVKQHMIGLVFGEFRREIKRKTLKK